MLTCLLLACVAPIPTWGQDKRPSNPASLQGSVRNSAGHPVAGATVSLQTKDSGNAQSIKADAAGNYSFPGIREGIYLLRVEMNGFGPATFGPCAIVSGERKTLDLTLEPTKKIPSQSSSPSPGKASGGSPEFFDEPQFTVAGVSDGTNLGGHGSNTIVRTKDALAKDIASLSSSPGRESRPPAEAAPSGDKKTQADVYHLRGDIEEKAGNPLDAVREYQRAAELNPSESNFFDWGAELLLHRAVEPAIEVFGKGNQLFPDSARLLVGLGVAWYTNGSYDQAAQRLCQASDLNPNDPKAYLFLGKIQAVEATQSDCSSERLARFVKLQPGNALANYYYGVNLWKRRTAPDDARTLEQAESHLKRAVELDPSLGIGYLQLGILYFERKDFANAVAAFQKATKAAPQLEEAHYRLSQAFKRTGDRVKADEELQLYNQISKKKDEEVERERRESRQFVYTLRSPDTPQPH